MCSTMGGGSWWLAVGGGWLLAVVGSGWWLVIGGWWRLVVVGSWRLVSSLKDGAGQTPHWVDLQKGHSMFNANGLLALGRKHTTL